MRGLNRVELIGNLGADPEIRSINDGTKVANVNIGVSSSWFDKTSGERKESTEWVRLVGWRNQAEALERCRKGSRVRVEGKLQTRQWEKDGVKQYTTEVNVFDVMYLDTRPEGASFEDVKRKVDRAFNGSAPPPLPESDDDDLPF
tara:strand:+ start:735 stop:1169 length:435 start_codon:yes stop_codon:yes gene_type:complete